MSGRAIAGTIDGNTASLMITGGDLRCTPENAGNATLIFSGAGNYGFVLEGRASGQSDATWTNIGSFTQDDTAKAVSFPISVGVDYRLRRTSGSIKVYLTG